MHNFLPAHHRRKRLKTEANAAAYIKWLKENTPTAVEPDEAPRRPCTRANRRGNTQSKRRQHRT